MYGWLMFSGFFGLLSILGLVAMIWVIYDVLVNQKAMPDVEKVIWVIVALLLGLIGAIIYYFIVKKSGKYEKPGKENPQPPIY